MFIIILLFTYYIYLVYIKMTAIKDKVTKPKDRRASG